MTAMYECLTPGRAGFPDQWRACALPGCRNPRRINKNKDVLQRLDYYKRKLDRGDYLNDVEQDDVDEIAKDLAKSLTEFMSVLSEAMRPTIRAISAAVEDFWKALPESVQQELLQQAEVKVSVNKPALDLNGVIDRDHVRAHMYGGRDEDGI